jgi:predicted MFS family arabinose efflux permease
VYVFRYLELAPVALGGTLVVQNSFAVVAVLTASPVTRRIGLYRLVPIFAPVTAAALFLIPAAALLPPLIALAAYSMLFGYCTTLWSIGSASLQQTLVPPGQIGRVTALSRTVGLAAIPIGAMIGGIAAERWGIVRTQLFFALVALACTTAASCGAWRAKPRPRPASSATHP